MADMLNSVAVAPRMAYSLLTKNINTKRAAPINLPLPLSRTLFSSPRAAAAEKEGDSDAAAAGAADEEKDGEAAGEETADEVDYAALVEEKDAEIADFKDKYMRGLADLENLRRRQVVELEKAKDFGIQKFSKDLITVADVLELAIENAPPGVSSSGADDVEVDPQLQNLFDGMDGTRKMLMKVFGSNGLQPSRPLDEVFDPNTMEAQFQVPDPTKEANTVAIVTRTGYILNERVIRPATVGVVHHP